MNVSTKNCRSGNPWRGTNSLSPCESASCCSADLKHFPSPLGVEQNPEAAKKLALEKARERQREKEKIEAREERMKIVKNRLRDTFTYEPPALIDKRHEFWRSAFTQSKSNAEKKKTEASARGLMELDFSI